MTGREWKDMMAKRMPEIDVSHLDDETKYYKAGVVQKPKVGAGGTADPLENI